jgi:hypothetical protein
MKECSKCKIVKDLGLFYKDSGNKTGYRSNCKECQNKARDKWAIENKNKLDEMAKSYRQRPDVKIKRNADQHIWRRKNLNWELWYKAKTRSQKLNCPFDLERSDIIIPHKCPILDIELFISSNNIGDHSPTVDRLDPSKGYIKGNITVISARANRIKNDATLEELEKIYCWVKEKFKESNHE